jgi:Protein of unknown function (DUF2846)
MKKLYYLLLIISSSALMTGCATGPKYSQVKASFPALAPENGRIYFYRITSLGAAVQPAVKLNGEEVGTAKPSGFFYVDRPPGNYKVETSTEVKRQLSLELDKNQTRYVRLNISIGFFVGHVYPELIEDAIGEKEISDCSYTGSK